MAENQLFHPALELILNVAMTGGFMKISGRKLLS